RYFIGSGLEHLQKDYFKRSFQFAIPKNPTEQQKIAEILETVDNIIEKEQKYKEKLEKLKQGFMEDLLTGKVRVNNLIKEDL
ncbi:MAG: restriction endonuclease subunit S, partial [Candidatus Parvarchaeota archaeon]|nr:restriction endonuclease subunit S [Candidatus Rehaiarchaeum fermentans]